MTRVADRIGWDKAAELVGKTERAVRDWSNPNTPAQIRLDDALKLDVAFLAAGGDCAPFQEYYRTRLDADVAIATGCLSELNRKISVAAREGGEAISAAIIAAQPGATERDLVLAEKELEESIEAKTVTLAHIRARRQSGAARAPEVAPVVEKV